MIHGTRFSFGSVRVAALAGLAALASILAPSLAVADTLTLKDGTVLTGKVSRELNGYVWFTWKVGGVERTEVYGPDKVSRLDKDSNPAPEAKPEPAKAEPAKPADPVKADPAKAEPAKAEPAKAAARPAGMGAPRCAVISLGGDKDTNMVGIYFTADSIRKCIPYLEEEKIETVVFRVNSGGGLALELQPLSDVIHNEVKPKFRTVAWIESAISAAAMTSHCIEEIYFMEKGNYGGCTMFRPDGSGGGIAAKGRELDEVLEQMRKISARGNHPPEIMRSMEIMEPLSCTIDENGDVHWYNNLEGQYIVNPADRVLTFDAPTALKYKFSRGTADNIEELAKAMGYTEVQWVGKTVPGVPYPVCKAEEHMRNFRETVHTDQKLTNTYFTEYGLAYQLAASSPPEDRGKFIARCNAALVKIERMVKNNPNFAFLIFNRLPEDFKYWLEDRREELRKLQTKK
jgi:hypothetical protein